MERIRLVYFWEKPRNSRHGRVIVLRAKTWDNRIWRYPYTLYPGSAALANLRSGLSALHSIDPLSWVCEGHDTLHPIRRAAKAAFASARPPLPTEHPEVAQVAPSEDASSVSPHAPDDPFYGCWNSPEPHPAFHEDGDTHDHVAVPVADLKALCSVADFLDASTAKPCHEVKFFEVLGETECIAVAAFRLGAWAPEEVTTVDAAIQYAATAVPRVVLVNLWNNLTANEPTCWHQYGKDAPGLPVALLEDAHKYIETHWDTLETGSVLDIPTVVWGVAVSSRPSRILADAVAAGYIEENHEAIPAELASQTLAEDWA